MRRSFSSILLQARLLKTKLLAKQAELDRYSARHGRQRADLQGIAETTRRKLRQQIHKLRQCKDENRLLRARIENWAMIWKLPPRNWKRSITYGATSVVKNAMVPCGHRTCRECLGLWLGQGKGCPWCRRIFEAGDIRDIYLRSPSEARDALEDG